MGLFHVLVAIVLQIIWSAHSYAGDPCPLTFQGLPDETATLRCEALPGWHIIWSMKLHIGRYGNEVIQVQSRGSIHGFREISQMINISLIESAGNPVVPIIGSVESSEFDRLIRKQARLLVERGYAVLPIKPGSKEPWTRRGYKSAVYTQDRIEAIFKGKPDANLGISTDRNLLVIDIDPGRGGSKSIIELRDMICGGLPETVAAKTGGGGLHLYYRYSGVLRKSRVDILPGIDIRAQGGYVVAPPSKHSSGKSYQWAEGHSPFDMPLTQATPGMLQVITTLGTQSPIQRGSEVPIGSVNPSSSSAPSREPSKPQVRFDLIPEGSRNDTLTSLGGSMRRRGMELPAIEAALLATNARISRPLSNAEVKEIARSVARYHPSDPVVEVYAPEAGNPSGTDSAEVSEEGEKVTLSDIEDLYLRLMPGADIQVLRATLGAYAANLFKGGDPVWLMLVGPSGTGKSETASILTELKDIWPVDTLNASSLLSGTSKAQMRKDDPGGLLLEIGDFGVLLLQDFSTVFSMRSAKQQELMSALRRVYDGGYSRSPGTGGTIRRWFGNVGLIGCSTAVIDRKQTIRTELGERFLFVRTGKKTGSARSTSTQSAGYESRAELRSQLRRTAVGLMWGFGTQPRPMIPGKHMQTLSKAADLTAKARTRVIRDKHGEITDISDTEGSNRIRICLETSYQAMCGLGYKPQQALETCMRVARDSISPGCRSQVLRELYRNGANSATQLAAAIGTYRMKMGRILEELSELGLVDLNASGTGNGNIDLAPQTRKAISGVKMF